MPVAVTYSKVQAALFKNCYVPKTTFLILYKYVETVHPSLWLC